MVGFFLFGVGYAFFVGLIRFGGSHGGRPISELLQSPSTNRRRAFTPVGFSARRALAVAHFATVMPSYEYMKTDFAAAAPHPAPRLSARDFVVE